MTDFTHPMFGWQIDSDGIVVLTMNDPDNSANTANDRFNNEFPAVLDHLEATRDSISGVVLTSSKKTFFAGADLTSFITAGPADVPDVEAMLNHLKVNLRRLETLGRPVVAAINGAALGGGYEIALACHHRVIVNSPNAVVGLPESGLGVLAGAGGTVRTVRMFGIEKALNDILLPGTKFTPEAAAEAGLVDEVVDSADDLISAAKRWIATHTESVQPWDTTGYRIPGGYPADEHMAPVLTKLPALLRKRTHGAPAPAAEAILAAVVEGAAVDFDNAQAIESRYCAGLVGSQISSNIIKATFFDPRVIRRGQRRLANEPPFQAGKVLVVGSCPVAGGIALACARAGIDVAVASSNVADAETTIANVMRALTISAASSADAVVTTPKLTAWSIDDSPADVDVVIESLFADHPERQLVLTRILDRLDPDTLVLSNSSALPISALAASDSSPERFAGLHFFAPVDKLKLVEVIVGEKTSDKTVAKILDFARQLDRMSIVVGDSPGFFTTRILHAFLDEAMLLLTEGVPASSIERAATQAGYPTGPLALLDDLGFPVMARISAEITGVQSRDDVAATGSTVGSILRRMVSEFDRSGRASAGGFYNYEEGRRRDLWRGQDEVSAIDCRIDFADLKERMLFREALEAIHCYEDGVVRTVPEANVGSILGVGFPSWTGGALQFANQYDDGLDGFIRRCEALARAYGPRFEPTTSLRDRAAAQGVYE
ncbi:enoyl-CoA hydratase-related protein [Rhodococcus opacus]|uniref:enoyl-CoA hydratase n=1 Tax=Rhodococcus opacus TaxID=37919 RepID=A0A2S8IYZ0_RHOOP|nr:enoyl-CoA hydratase-related protein [Rhodococcus opacus]PQP20026.1 3-hydroxyacyl-CoA dehydrogenase [Rhodococcus opacus]